MDKYPRTLHLPWSPGSTNDDKVIDDVSHFRGKEVVVTVKMDGENTTMYRDYIHARSVDSKDHPSRHWVKNLHSNIHSSIPEGWRICGENLWAKHSIHYKHLENFFLVFSIWDENNKCLSWRDTENWAAYIGLKTVPVLYKGPWLDRNFYQETWQGDPCEGYVVRLANEFPYGLFEKCVVKYVRKGHVQTDEHWLNSHIVKNQTNK